MKTARRHELQTNQLADWLGEKIAVAQKYSKAIVVTLVAVFVLIAAYAYITRQSKLNEETLWANVLIGPSPDALRSLADSYPDSEAGVFARLALANQQLNDGVRELFDQRSVGMMTLAAAAKNFRQVASTTRQRELVVEATIGLAKAYESQGQFDDARQQYQAVIDGWPDTVYAAEAQQRLTELAEGSTQEFYAWLASLKQKSPMLDLPGMPGERLPFDLDGLPEGHPDITLPGVNVSGEDKPKDESQTESGKEPAADDKATDDAKSPGDEKPVDTNAGEDKPADETPDSAKSGDAGQDGLPPADAESPK